MSTRRPRKPGKRKTATRSRKASTRRTKHRPVTSPVRRKRSFRRSLSRLLWTGIAGALSGAMLACLVLWRDATRSVDAYFASPPVLEPSTIHSDVFSVERGAAVSQSRLIADLLAAGFERTTNDSDPQNAPSRALAVRGNTVTIWTPIAEEAERWDVGRMEIEWGDGRVVRTRPSDGVVLPPVPLATLGDLARQRDTVTLDTLGPWLEPALVAMEDTRFRDHSGIDPLGIARAVVVNVFTNQRQQGGSTITQQLAKNLFAGSSRSIQRKIREAFFAAALEAHLSKDELLSLYLSEVYLGQMGGLPLHGVHQASMAWFGTSPEQLTLAQAASVIGTIPAPNLYSPARHPERAKARRNLVISRLESLGLIGRDTAANARQSPLTLSGIAPSRIRGAPYAVDYLIEQAEESLGQGGLTTERHTVQSTIVPTLQHAAEVAVQNGLSAMEKQYPATAGAQAALVALRASDGAIVAMVGGRSYTATSFNRAAHAHRHAGSTVKPFLALTALDRGLITPASLLEDEAITRTLDGQIWAPQNADGTFEGTITVRRAIERSRNIPMVHLSERVGLRAFQTSLRSAGFDEATALPSSALGAFDTTPLELASAYTLFAEGVRTTPFLIRSIDDRSHENKTGGRQAGKPLASVDAVAQTSDMLRGVVDRGTGSGLQDASSRLDIVGKTGTTDGFRDAWFAGATPELSIVVWVGMDKGNLGLSGSRAALPIWREFVTALPPSSERLPHSERLISIEICEEDGLLSCDQCASPYSEWFIPGTEPTRSCKPTDGLMDTLEKWFKKPPEAETTRDDASPRKNRRQQRGGSKGKPKVRPPP